MKKQLATVKNHIIKHRAKYAVAATLAVVGVVYVRASSEIEEFLDENDLSLVQHAEQN